MAKLVLDKPQVLGLLVEIGPVGVPAGMDREVRWEARPLGRPFEEKLEASGGEFLSPLRGKEKVLGPGGLLEPLLPGDKLPEVSPQVLGEGHGPGFPPFPVSHQKLGLGPREAKVRYSNLRDLRHPEARGNR